jgi:CelD/BcsL family acetyltransferase involved in cellulose biosynthesis
VEHGSDDRDPRKLVIIELCEEGVIRYDLGTEMDYKRRWAEEVMETEMLVLVR